jgi:LPXTG-site transpeptidase (sortase) family protein
MKITFSGNHATEGGGIANSGGALTVSNSTFAANGATRGGGIHNTGTLNVTNSTFSANSASDNGGGIYNSGGSATFRNSLVAGSLSGGNCSGAIGGSNNLADDNSCGAGFTQSSSILLGALGSYGGSTQTLPLLPGSAAIDTGNDAICAAAVGAPNYGAGNADQRGVSRTGNGAHCDIGAYERQSGVLGSPPVVTAASIPGLGVLLEGQQFTSGFSQLMVTFDQDVLHDGSIVAADNPANYLLVRAGGNGVQTVSCGAGVSGGDTAIHIDSVTYANNGGAGPFEATLSLNGGTALPNGTYRLFVCGTTSITNPGGDELYAGLTDYDTVFIIAPAPVIPTSAAASSSGGGARSGSRIPDTGFAPGRVTPLSPQSIPYTDLGDFWLEVPKLGMKMPIVGVPKKDEGWDVSWLGSNAGWLEGSAYPSWAGNSVLTGHVWNADNSAGPFRYLNTLWWGDKVIVHASGQQYVYEVRSVKEVKPTDIDAMLKHEELPWLTLVSCKDYVESTGEYRYRVLVRAVLVEVK